MIGSAFGNWWVILPESIDPENAYGKQALSEAERLFKAKAEGKIQ